MWNAAQYQLFSEDRSRPFFDLVGRIGGDHPLQIADLGCGPGNVTATLCDRWTSAHVHGVDSSSEMIAAASPQSHDRLSFEVGDLATWLPPQPLDVIVSNATLQWVPGHVAMLPQLVGHLSPGGWFAMQVPANLHDPQHEAIAELATSAAWAPLLEGRYRRFEHVLDPAGYADVLAHEGCTVDAWETTYLHILPGPDPVLEWIKGTALRPVLSALDALDATGEAAARFCSELAPTLRSAYPPRSYGTPFPFRRVFAVAQRLAGNKPLRP